MKIIMIAGKKGSGKDFVADYLVKKHGYKRYAFADIMKQILAVTLGISINKINQMKKNNYNIDMLVNVVKDENFWNHIYHNITMREILQKFGTEAMKPVFGNDIWAKLVFDKIKKDGYNKVVISDFRFTEEYYYFADNKDNEDEILCVQIGSTDISKDSHISENHLGEFHFDKHFFNDKETEQILKDVNSWISNYR